MSLMELIVHLSLAEDGELDNVYAEASSLIPLYTALYFEEYAHSEHGAEMNADPKMLCVYWGALDAC